MKTLKKFALIVLFLMLVLPVSFSFINVSANSNSYSNYGATYKVKNVTDEKELGYGVSFHREKATLTTTKTGVTNSITVNQEYGQQVSVLEIESGSEAILVPYAFLDGGQWHATSVRKAALQYEATHPGYKVLAAVNGDYFRINDAVKTSTGVTIGQGEYYKSISNHSNVNTIAIKNSGEGKQLFTTRVQNTQLTLTIYDNSNNIIKKINIDNVNTDPGEGEISLFYSQRAEPFITTMNRVTTSDFWFIKRGTMACTALQDSFYGYGAITEFSTTSVELLAGQFGIKCNNDEISELLGPNVIIRCQYEFTDPSVAGIENFIGFPFTIIENGEVRNNDANRHPRTIIGQTEEGKIVLAVVDGRQEGSDMYGASCVEMAALMGYYGCVDAWNLDGGGSSTMIVRKQTGWDFVGKHDDENNQWHVTNSPSDGSERSDGNHLLVVVKSPEVIVEVDRVTESLITLHVALVENLDKYKELYVYFDGEFYPVTGNKVTFTELNKNTEYKFEVFSKVDGNYVDLMSAVKYNTNKSAPTTVSVELNLYKKNDKYQIMIKFTVDNSEAIKTIVLESKDRYLTASNIVFTDIDPEFYTTLKDAFIEVTYNVNDLIGEQELIIYDFELTAGLLFTQDEIFNKTNSLINGIFE